ncbi:hypothetical protein GE21DRAFT_8415 [Neurospora crassa]|uniref:Uncharacterized protein n=1 Tax=Neurospora crassa (strain ATCC 24698 / 74-OR23-1A / CBS 708.71 / DSM 1257 / FGSC 987) TaxID=367110 RepID=Q7S1K6_NEUCR|nr:hypothetical protein NCU09949 [Neurospora crassa OR74A]EAA29220.1 hypothetical protein NCU09949 [Neurospora crassa OR74A]KHE79591.1 hypothetical protein GE21DRAFT_8415 [Neurospora crassa]|eukprot:XP_958456.1 hypothetical protein NCU09949 [Neurospora crassa OR74A]
MASECEKNTVDPRPSTSTQLVEARDYSIIADLLLPSQPLVLTMDLDLHDPDNDALSRFPIPHLAQDLSNYYAWQHALYFHLRYHGVFYFITGHEQSRWDLRWQACGVDDNDDDGNPNPNPNPPPTKHDRKNYQRRNMHAYAILFSKIESIVPALLAAGWDGDKDSFGFRTDLLWNRVQELRHVQREQREQERVASRLGTTNHSMSSRAISLTDDE